MRSTVTSVNLAHPRPNPHKRLVRLTGIDKRPTTEPVEVCAPGGRQSGLAGDFIGDRKHHGGDRQAVYAFQREDLDAWSAELDRQLPDGSFGENLTTRGIDLNAARVGERWRIGSAEDEAESVELEVTVPRIPCATFAGWLDERGWARRFTIAARPGTYLRVVRGGRIRTGDPLEVTFVPDHEVSVALVFRAITRERDQLPRLRPAWAYLEPETRELVEQGRTVALDGV